MWSWESRSLLHDSELRCRRFMPLLNLVTAPEAFATLTMKNCVLGRMFLDQDRSEKYNR